MADFAELERAKRRRLQEAYADLRTGAKRDNDDDRQAKLWNLLHPGTPAASAPIAAGCAAGGSSDPAQDPRALATAAAASITAISSPVVGPLRARRSTFASPPAAHPTSIAGHSMSPAARAFSAPAGAPATTSAHAHTTAAPGHSPGHFVHGPRPASGGGHPGGAAGGRGACRRPPPPGPMEGGFLMEADPVHRLSRMPGAALLQQQGAAGASGCGVNGAGAAPGQWATPSGGTIARGPLEGMGMPATGVRYGGGVTTGRATGGLGPPVHQAGGGLGARQQLEEEDEDEVEVPSDVELALVSLKTDFRSHPGCAELPPLALRSQLSCMLTDKSTVERQLDEQRRANRVRVFKLPTGPDEFGVLTTSDYRAIIWQAADAAANAAAAAEAIAARRPEDAAMTTAAASLAGRRTQSAPGACGQGLPQPAGAYGVVPLSVAPGADGGRTAVCSSRWHVAADLYLRRVIGRFTDFQLSHGHLIQLLSSPEPGPAGAGRPPGHHTVSQGPQQQQQRPGGSGAQGRQRSGAVGSGGHGTAALEEVDEQVSVLLHLGAIARHTDGDADAYVLAVPGAGRVVKSILGGRKELLAWLGKRQNQEAPEEQICKLKLRSSCLPPLFHVRDLEGRGAVRRVDSTVGRMIMLPGKKGALRGRK